MKEPLGVVPLLNRITNKFVNVDIFRGFDEGNRSDIESKWKPEFQKKTDLAEKHGLSREQINAQDAHWEWVSKAERAEQNPLVYDIFVLEHQKQTEALMLVQKGGINCFCRSIAHKGMPQVYVDLLATAPWNRPMISNNPILKGAGQALIGVAVSLSLEEELQGRIGLHSLSGAETFYRDVLKMEDLGEDKNYYGMRYFEFTEALASEFLNSNNTQNEEV
ncbi:hypothetical protein KFE96_01675 [Kordiimonas sp. SCSIO 12603]|uniref:hypothetical protein n=1 Tax=Kordiimonas sp. SCSIO 12603 TaxID=2829596 RepID=UPI0021033D63|nr:hypothetical protein [Kordiimonas sp. SCSIO 12603]UTW59042.1 hypothetical protein KFE96_01675 [Kordiimonas sp. SCSIO 12603]